MFLLSFLDLNWNFSPLEQFDSVTFIGWNFLFENAQLYTFYIFETEYSAVERVQNNIGGFVGILNYISSVNLFGLWVVLPILFTLAITLVTRSTNKDLFANLFGDFSILFMGILFILFLPMTVEYLFISNNDATNSAILNLFYNYTNINSVSVPEFSFTWNSIPQVYYAFLIDENFISFLLAFFLLGGSEDDEDEDFLLDEEGSDFIDDIVTPLFLANLGKDIDGNGELLLKVSSVFSFVLINNLMGMLPYSDTGTSSLMLTFWVAFSIFISLLTLMISKHGITYLFGLFMPTGCPLWLTFLLIPIEFISYSFRLVSLSVRLFANMMAGHTLLKVIVGFSFSMILIGDSMLIVNLFPISILFILTFLEVGVALIQAYIFTVLTCIYLKDIFVSH